MRAKHMERMRMNTAVAQGIRDEMRRDSTVIVMGEDVAVAGGPFKTSAGLLDEFGPNRVRDTPISEMAFVGAAVGAAAVGMRPVVEIMFMEFLGVALDQLVTEGALFRYLSGGQLSVPMVVRASVGSGTGFAAQHSRTMENWVAAAPGLTVVSPSDPQSAYSLIRSAIQHPDPVIVLEPRALYGTRADVDTSPDGQIALGSARILRAGTDVTLIGLGRSTGTALKAADLLFERGVDAEVIDLLTLVPWDSSTVLGSVRRTGRLAVVEEAPHTGGWGAMIASTVASEAFDQLRAAPLRITTPDTPVPYGRALEARYAPSPEEVESRVAHLVATGGILPPWWVRDQYTAS